MWQGGVSFLLVSCEFWNWTHVVRLGAFDRGATSGYFRSSELSLLTELSTWDWKADQPELCM